MRHFLLFASLILVLITGCSTANRNNSSNDQFSFLPNSDSGSQEVVVEIKVYPSAATLEGSSFTQAQADQRCSDAWAYFKQELVQSSGAVLKTEDNTVVSEGQSYGMMLAVQNNDQATFDKIWYWTKTNLQTNNPYGLFAWHAYPNGFVIDQQPAPDAEEMIAMALFFAAQRWGDSGEPYDYSTQAKSILVNILKYEMTSDYYLTANAVEKTKFNPSYYMPAFYRLFATYSGNSTWNTVASNTYKLINDCTKSSYGNTSNGLVPDWCLKDGSLLSTGQDFYYDAMRVPFFIGLDAVWFPNIEPQAQTYVDKVIGFFALERNNLGNRYQLDGKKLSTSSSVAWLSSFAGGAMGGSSNINKVDFYNHLMNLAWPTGQYRYYDICWLNFGLLMSSGNFRVY